VDVPGKAPDHRHEAADPLGGVGQIGPGGVLGGPETPVVMLHAAALSSSGCGSAAGAGLGAPITGGPKEGAERAKRMQSMQERLAAKLASNPRLARLAKKVRMVDTAEGIRIDLVDDADFSMFQLGTTVLTPEAAELMAAIGTMVAPEPGALSIRGHTDALPYNGGIGANNWSLSAGRAEATRQALLREGLSEARFRKIEGVADREPLVRDNPADPRNRRMSILLMR
jgi:chemotaxis protein MotB